MSTNFPTSIDALTNPAGTDSVVTVDHAAQHANANDAIEALETKVGVDSSAVTTSLDYKLKNTSSTDPGHKHTEGAITLADVTTLDVTSTKHGLVPKAPADATKFLNGAATPAFALVKDSDLSTSDITTNDVTTSKHGFVPKAPNDTTKFLRGDGSWQVPAGTSLIIETTVGTTHSLTTIAGQKVMVWVTGVLRCVSAGTSTRLVSVKYNSVTKNSATIYNENVTTYRPFSLMYTETPGAATQNITVTTDADTLADVVIMVLKI